MVGKTRRRLAAELITELEAIDCKINAGWVGRAHAGQQRLAAAEDGRRGTRQRLRAGPPQLITSVAQQPQHRQLRIVADLASWPPDHT
ncbi:MAG: hypothetical protein ACRDOK_16805 [Streptosporangiaceae bacterium]